MKKSLIFFTLFFFILVSLMQFSHAVRCYYDGDGDLYGNYFQEVDYPTTSCGGIANMICSPEDINNGESCTMIGFDCNDGDSTLGERCSNIYCYKDSDQDTYVIHNDYYIVGIYDSFYDEYHVCSPGYTDEEDVASSQDDCDDNNPNLTDNCNALINPVKKSFIKNIQFKILRYLRGGR